MSQPYSASGIENTSNHYAKKLQDHDRRSPSPVQAGESPRLSRKAISSLGDSEKTGVPLNSSWTLWLDRAVPNLTASEYEATLRKIYTVSTIESFWGVFNHIPVPSRLVPRYSYHFMRNNIRPMWEDEINKNGGMWKLRCHKLCTDDVWRELLLACIGEQFADFVNKDDDVIGLSVSIRKNDDLVQVWNINSSGAEDCKVLEKIKSLLPNIAFETSFYKGRDVCLVKDQPIREKKHQVLKNYLRLNSKLIGERIFLCERKRIIPTGHLKAKSKKFFYGCFTVVFHDASRERLWIVQN